LKKFLTDSSFFHVTGDDDLYEALAQMLSKKHVTDIEMDLDLDAISHGDFRDVPQGHLAFLKNPNNASGEVQNILSLHFSIVAVTSLISELLNNCAFYGLI